MALDRKTILCLCVTIAEAWGKLRAFSYSSPNRYTTFPNRYRGPPLTATPPMPTATGLAVWRPPACRIEASAFAPAAMALTFGALLHMQRPGRMAGNGHTLALVAFHALWSGIADTPLWAVPVAHGARHDCPGR